MKYLLVHLTSCFLSLTNVFFFPFCLLCLSQAPKIILLPIFRNISQIGFLTGNISWIPQTNMVYGFFETHRIWAVASPTATFPTLHEDAWYTCHATSCWSQGFVKVIIILPFCFLCRSFAYSQNKAFVYAYIYAFILPHLFLRQFAALQWIFVRKTEKTCWGLCFHGNHLQPPITW